MAQSPSPSTWSYPNGHSLLSWPLSHRVFVLVGAALAALTAGCERSASTQSPPPTAEVQGAPIKTATKSAPTPVPAPTAAMAKPAATMSNTAAAVAPNPASATNFTTATPIPPGPASVSSNSASTQPPASGDTVRLGFDQLSAYTFEVSDELLGPVTNNVAEASEKTNAQIPQQVKAYNTKKVALKGFMLPLKVEGGLVTEMLIMKDQSMCCYGTTPRINDWVSVKMKKKGVRPLMDLPVTLHGTMRVGEMRENGYLVGIYSMDGEELEAPEVP